MILDNITDTYFGIMMFCIVGLISMKLYEFAINRNKDSKN